MKAIKSEHLASPTEDEYQNTFLIEILNVIKTPIITEVKYLFSTSRLLQNLGLINN